MQREKPRPIEFMTRGYTVAQMMEILAEWDRLGEDELRELGFMASTQFDQVSGISPSTTGQCLSHSNFRPLPVLRVLQGGRQSDLDSER